MPGRTRNRRRNLDREVVAREALALVDGLGPEALTYRHLAERLGVGTMTLYTYARSRDELVRSVAALLLKETDTSAVPGEAWGETMRRVCNSQRAMAIRHPRAYSLLIGLPHDQSPILEHEMKVLRLHQPYGEAPGLPRGWLSILVSYTEGFLGRMTAAIIRAEDSATSEDSDPPILDPILEAELKALVDGDAFDRGLWAVLEGLRTLALAEGS